MDDSKLFTLAAALKEGGYTAAKSYLYRAKQESMRAGHEWSEALQDVPSAFLVEEVAMRGTSCVPPERPVTENGPVVPYDPAIVASAWMKRGLEAASVLGEQVTVREDRKEATIDLGPTGRSTASMPDLTSSGWESSTPSEVHHQ